MTKIERYGWPRLMRISTAAAYLNVSTATFLAEVERGRLPLPLMVGRQKRWDRYAIDDLLSGDADERDWVKDQPGLS